MNYFKYRKELKNRMHLFQISKFSYGIDYFTIIKLIYYFYDNNSTQYLLSTNIYEYIPILQEISRIYNYEIILHKDEIHLCDENNIILKLIDMKLK